MKLLKIFDKRDSKVGSKDIMYRKAVRALILKDGKILLVHSEKANEFKFPGGGIEQNESKQEALKREVLEETGHKIISVNEGLGYTDQIYNDIYDGNKYFYQRSFYYFCEVDDEYTGMSLKEYEIALKYIPKWVTIEEAIKENETKMATDNEFPWTERETYILKLLKEMI